MHSAATVAVASTALDPVDLPVTTPPTPSDNAHPPRESADIAYRHRCWWRERQRVRTALVAADVPDRRLERYDYCGSAAWIVRHPDDPERLRIAASCCHDRYCQPCAGARSHAVACNLADLMQGARHRMVTLTLAHNDEPLAEQLDRLYRHYRRLRQRKLWRSKVTAAAAFLEIKRSKDGQRWHPHLHALTQSQWIPHGELSADWHQVTGDSYIVDVRAVRSDHAARYVAKYASKALKTEYAHTPELLAEAIAALSGRRLIILSGAWCRARLTERPEPEGWEPVAPLNHILALAAAGNASALSILAKLDRSQTCQTDPARAPPRSPGQ